MKLLGLPPELLLRILKGASALSSDNHVPRFAAAFESSLTNRPLRSSTKLNSTRLEWLTRHPAISLPPARLDALRAYQDAWSRLDWTGVLRLDSGALTWTIVDDVLAVLDRSGKFLFQTIPSTLRGNKPGRQWSFPTNSTKKSTEDFGFDPSQNLLVYLTPATGTCPLVSVHICSLVDGTPHPLAKGDLILDTAYEYNGLYEVNICGPYIAVIHHHILGHTPPRVFRWKTGLPILLDLIHGTEIEDLAFINERYLLLSVNETVVTKQSPKFYYLLVWDIEEDRPLCELNLPFEDLGSLPEANITFDYPSTASPADCFTPSSEIRGFTIEYSVHGVISNIRLFASTLTKFIRKASTLSHCLEIEWASWSSETTICNDDADPRAFYRHAFGKKLAILETVDMNLGLRLFDFDKHAVLRRKFLDANTNDNWVTHDGLSGYPNPLKAVSSYHLPFNQHRWKSLPTKGEIGSTIEGLAITADAIILILTTGFDISYF